MSTVLSAPPINLPPSKATCKVSIIDATCDIVSKPASAVAPPIAGHEWLNLPTSVFLIEHERTGSRLLFDLGCRTDFENFVERIQKILTTSVPGIRVQREVLDTLSDHGVETSSIEAAILSHWHFDHCGNLGRLHPGTDLVVGPGFKDAFLPGYPTKETSAFKEEDFRNVNVIEVPFEGGKQTLKLGDFRAYDYFGDGSLYILDVPGHTVGHISALVRTTPETAIFLGGDICHFTGAFRPTKYDPMPDPLPLTAVLDKRFSHPCPCALFTACHPDQANARETPFYECASDPACWHDDPTTANVSVKSLIAFDANPDILVLIAHDPAPRDTVTFFPHGTLNEWQARGWKDGMRWHFVNELPVDGRMGRPPLVDGSYVRGVRVSDLYGNKSNDA